MPSNPNILSDPSTTFAGYPELATKVDESPVADADIDEYAGAAYPNFVDTCLKDVNKAARGEKPFTEHGMMARFGGAPDSGWMGNGDDIVVGRHRASPPRQLGLRHAQTPLADKTLYGKWPRFSYACSRSISCPRRNRLRRRVSPGSPAVSSASSDSTF